MTRLLWSQFWLYGPGRVPRSEGGKDIFPGVRGAQVRISKQGEVRHKQRGDLLGPRGGRGPRRKRGVLAECFSEELRDDY